MTHFIIGADIGGIGAVIIVAIFLFLKFSGKKIGGGIENTSITSALNLAVHAVSLLR